MANDDLSLYQQIFLLALHNKQYPDYYYQHRCLARWFSNTFSTPYDVAFKMHLEELLFHRYEYDTQHEKPSIVKQLFRKEFIESEKRSEEKEKIKDEAWQERIANQEFKRREKELKQAEEELIKDKDKEELPGGAEMPPDVKKTW